MVDYPNPVVKSVLARDVIPFVPVWLFGVVIAAVLDAFRVDNRGLPVATFFEFAVVYSGVVLALGFGLFYRHFRSCPATIRIDVDGLTGYVHRASGTPEKAVPVTFPYSSFHSITGGGFFGPRVVARNVPGGPNGKPRRWDFLHLTPENAARVAAAYQAWVAREGPEAGGDMPGAIIPTSVAGSGQ
jgi:hypothetical protein